MQLAAEHVDFAVTSVLHSAEAAFHTADAAINAFVDLNPEIVIIDARRCPSISSSASPSAISTGNSSRTTVNSKSNQEWASSVDKSNHFDPLTICK